MVRAISCTTRYPQIAGSIFTIVFFLLLFLLFPISLFQIEESVSLASKIWSRCSPGQKEGKHEKWQGVDMSVCLSAAQFYVPSVTCGNTVLFRVYVRRMKTEMAMELNVSFALCRNPCSFQPEGTRNFCPNLPQRVIIFLVFISSLEEINVCDLYPVAA